MIERKTILDQYEVTRDGVIQVRIGLLLIEDGVETDCKWHRTVIPPGISVDAQMALVNDHLKAMGKPTLDDEQIARLVAVAAREHTTDVVKAFAAKQEAASKAAQAPAI
jgi:hypothetical protein